ncbi:hypothetical protein [Parafrankia sp. EUN1f]|uniref:hypothetical protein n=1 Tax=Parafrankia sp. EUN1f TaxID=102897 RepID=UPI0002F0CB09|nr:hypothetical protein [Parafrankia sp. EUN1f]
MDQRIISERLKVSRTLRAALHALPVARILTRTATTVLCRCLVPGKVGDPVADHPRAVGGFAACFVLE